MTTTPEKIDRIVTLRANAPVAITVDLASEIGAQFAATVPEDEWVTFLTRYIRNAVGDAFQSYNVRPDGSVGGVHLDLGPEGAWDVSDVLADVNRETGEVILPPAEAVLANIELAGLIAQLVGYDPDADDPDA